MKTKNDTLNAIQTMVDSAVNKAGYDKTRNAVVIARNANNTYKIKMDGIEYDNVVFYGSGEAQVNEVVKVVIPNNQASQMYVMGKGGFELPRHIEVDELVTQLLTTNELTISLDNCTITDSGTALSVTEGASTDDGKLAQAIIDAFDYVTAKEILIDGGVLMRIRALLTKLIGCSYTEREEDGWYIKKYANGKYEAIKIRNYGQITLGTSVTSSWRRSVDLLVGTLPSDIPASAQIEVVYLGNSSNSPAVLERTSQTTYHLGKSATSSVTLQNNMFLYRIVGGYSIT